MWFVRQKWIDQWLLNRDPYGVEGRGQSAILLLKLARMAHNIKTNASVRNENRN